jgi:hypothetical protein
MRGGGLIHWEWRPVCWREEWARHKGREEPSYPAGGEVAVLVYLNSRTNQVLSSREK